MDSTNLHASLQSAYKKPHSTDTAISKASDDMLKVTDAVSGPTASTPFRGFRYGGSLHTCEKQLLQFSRRSVCSEYLTNKQPYVN